MFGKEVYIERRRKLRAQVKDGIILLLGNEDSSINFKDNHYPFRQDSSFLYFTGIDRPGLAMMIDIDEDKEMLFGNEPGPEDLIWTGPLEGLHDRALKAGISAADPLSSLAPTIKNFLSKKRKIHFLPPYRPENIQKLGFWMNAPFDSLKALASVDLVKAVVAQRSFKSKEEVREIESAVNITRSMQLEAVGCAREGMTEAEIAGRIQGIALGTGGNLSFPTILTVNGQILHNHVKGNKLEKGQLVLCDCGAETAMHYAGDLTRTFPVSSAFDQRQEEIYEVVLRSHLRAVEALVPGRLFRDIHLLACEKLVEGLQQIGLMKGDVKEAVVQGAHAMFFQCGLGHMMGLDVHDMEDLGEEYVGYTEGIKKSAQFGLKSLRLGRALEPGFVITVEPGIYFIPELMDRWAAEKRFPSFINYKRLQTYRNFGGIRIEEDFLITGAGGRLLGDPLFRTAKEIKLARTAALHAGC